MNAIAPQTTVLLITYNEEPNIARVLERLGWAPRILVVDSGSTDTTVDILRAHPVVEIVERPFDTFASQCNFGLGMARTPWVLSLDADYVLSRAFVDEIQTLYETPEIDGYRVRFVYKINGRAVRGGIYPPRTVLYRVTKARYEDEGHGHRVRIAGRVKDLKAPIDHDDRKPLARWFGSQQRYATLEAAMLIETGAGGAFTDRLRRVGWIIPLLVPFYVLFLKGGVLSGRTGWAYALQRTLAEILIALEVLDRRLSSRANDPSRTAAGATGDESEPTDINHGAL